MAIGVKSDRFTFFRVENTSDNKKKTFKEDTTMYKQDMISRFQDWKRERRIKKTQNDLKKWVEKARREYEEAMRQI